MKKRLVYYLYYNKKYNEDATYAYHMFCLSKYIGVFSKIEFFIAVDDVNDYDTIRKVETRLFSLNIKGDISFSVVENTNLCEARVFYDQIIVKLGEYDGLTFFGHNKGLTNKKSENLSYWIAALYFFNFRPEDEIRKHFKNGGATYGNPAIIYDPGEIRYTRYQWCNSVGTFFWMNEIEVKNLLLCNDIEILPPSDRYYAESFVCNHFKPDIRFGIHNCFGVNMIAFYDEGKEYIKTIYETSPFWEEFLAFHDEMIKTGANSKFINI